MSGELLALVQRYLRGEAPLEATAQACARAFTADGWALHVDPTGSDLAVVRRAEELQARYGALTAQRGEAAG
jgi:hypothetical protein